MGIEGMKSIVGEKREKKREDKRLKRFINMFIRIRVSLLDLLWNAALLVALRTWHLLGSGSLPKPVTLSPILISIPKALIQVIPPSVFSLSSLVSRSSNVLFSGLRIFVPNSYNHLFPSPKNSHIVVCNSNNHVWSMIALTGCTNKELLMIIIVARLWITRQKSGKRFVKKLTKSTIVKISCKKVNKDNNRTFIKL